jgi:predicted dehydrogenase
MERSIRWGILGAASFAERVMGRAIHAARGAELAALATRSAEKAARFSAFAPGLRVHDGYDALLADAAVDAVYIPLPNTLHAEWTQRALDAGKAVLCEKPVGMSVAEIDRMIVARDRAGRLAAEAYMIVHHPQWQRARALIAEGAIGTVAEVECAFSIDQRDPANIRNQQALGGGGLRDLGVYPIGAARFAMGAEPELTAATARWENGVDTHAEVVGRIGGARFAFRTSTRMAPWQEMTFHGEDGLIRLTAPFNPVDFAPAELHLIRSPAERSVERFPAAFQYVAQVEAFGASMATGAAYPVPLEWSRGTQALIDAVFERVGPPTG